MNDDKICFVISPIGNEGTQTRMYSDLTYDYIIKPIVKEAGYKLIRADRMRKSGMIANHIIKQLLNSELVIADLTDYNPNVFYELAIRHITQKACIQMIKRGQQVPFDIYGIQTIYFETDLASAERAKNDLKEQIELIESGEFKVANPITPIHNDSAIQQALQDSKRELSGNDILQAIFESVSDLTYGMSMMQRDISSLKEPEKYSMDRGQDYSKKRIRTQYQFNTRMVHLYDDHKEITGQIDELQKEYEYLKQMPTKVCKGESDIPYEYLAERLLKEIEILEGKRLALKMEIEELSREFNFNPSPL